MRGRILFLALSICIVLAAAWYGGAEHAPALAAFFTEVNAAYFAGRMDAVDWDEALFAEWRAQEGFLSNYLETIAGDGFQNHTETTFTFGGSDS